MNFQYCLEFLSSSGGQTNIPISFYSNVLTHIASHGFIVVGMNSIRSLNPEKQSSKVNKTIDWLRDGNLVNWA